MMLRRRTMGVSSKVLPYDAKIEWLRSTGIQRITLPVSVSAGDFFEVSGEFYPQATDTHKKLIDTNITDAFVMTSNTIGDSSILYGTAISSNYTNGGMSFPKNQFSTFALSIEGKTINGVFTQLKREIKSGKAFSSVYLMYGDKVRAKWFKVKIGTNVVYDLIPVRKGNTGYMYDKISGELFGNTGTGRFDIGWDVDDVNQEYLTFEALEDSVFSLSIPAAVDTTKITDVSYSLDNGSTWTTTSNSAEAVTITTPTIQAGSKVLWKGNATAFANSDSVYSRFTSTGNFKCRGNILSLVYGDNFIGVYSTRATYSFPRLFYYNTKLIDASKLLIPLYVSNYSFMGIFQGCSNMIYPPLRIYGGDAMQSFSAAFYGCGIEESSDIMNAAIGLYGFNYLFQYCSKLKKIKIYSTGDYSDTYYTNRWVEGVAANGTIYKKASLTLPSGTSGIPSGWEVVEIE